jgi:coenzyme F420 hydrogenase subunit beta
MASIRTIEDVVSWQLCTGCGACAFAESGRYEMVDMPAFGRRPTLRANPEPESGLALKVCPAVHLEHEESAFGQEIDQSMRGCWGPVLAVHEGHAADPATRRAGSSGGVATALADFALASCEAAGVLHIAMDEEKPWINKAVYSTERQQLISRTGSRYSPASPCERLDRIIASDKPSVFIGKPCDVAAVRKLQLQIPELKEKVKLTVAFFCAGVPSTAGLESLLRREGLDELSNLKSLRFRGDGWPGEWHASWEGANGHDGEARLSYEESWGYLQSYRQWRCYICPDHSGEFADVSVGDPWYRTPESGNLGSSLIVVRTSAGKAFLERAVDAGMVTITEHNDRALLAPSQPNLVNARAVLWGRLLALRIVGAGVPRYPRFGLFQFWSSHLSVAEKLRSVLGTLRRAFRKKLHRPLR